MRRWLFLLLAVFASPTAAQQDVRQLQRMQQETERAFAEHGAAWERAVLEGTASIHDARGIIQALSQAESLLSSECAQDIAVLMRSLLDFEESVRSGNASLSPFARQVILPMLDSAGKIGPAILRGHLYFAGHYSECVSINYPLEGRQRPFKGAYFKVSNDIAFRSNVLNGSCSDGDIGLKLKFGVCLPDGCTSADLMAVFKPEQGAPLVTNPVCLVQRTNDDIPKLDAGFYITLSIMTVIALLSIISAIADYFLSDTVKSAGKDQALLWRLLMAFSLYANVSSIFDVSSASAKSGQIGPIHCIRFFSMSWVVLGHFLSNFLVFSANPFDIFKMGKDFLSEIIMNAYFAVDSFFFMSGLLLTFIWFKNYQKHPAETISVKAWIMFYVHRILRLSPPYYMAVAFYAWIFKQLLRDLPINMNKAMTADYCSETWYIELLYAHNWWKQDKPCFGVAWYLASEMQIYLFTPFVIFPLAIKPVIGFVFAAGIFALSTAANIFLVYHFHWPTNGAYFFNPDPEMTHIDDYSMLMYDSPLIRCQIYIMGMLVGWLLQHKREMRINRFVNLACWVLGLSLMLCVVLGLHDQTNGFFIPIFWRAMYSALSRIAWGLGLSWIIISCWYGYGGPINEFMSWHIWIPLGRLTYCGYLTHIPVMVLVLAQSTDTVYFTTFIESFVTRVVSVIAMTFLVSTFWSALFEISFGKLQSILLGGMRPSSLAKVKSALSEEEGTSSSSTKEEEKKVQAWN